jgi:hypothetical protein
MTDDIYKSSEYSFTPNINDNIKINSSFTERNERLAKLKKNVIETLEKVKGTKSRSKSKKPTEKEKVLIDRLYTKDVEKIREKNKVLNELRKDHKIKFRTYGKKDEGKKDIFAVLNDIEQKLKNDSNLKNESGNANNITEVKKDIPNITEVKKEINNIPFKKQETLTPKNTSKDKSKNTSKNHSRNNSKGSSKEINDLKKSRDAKKFERFSFGKTNNATLPVSKRSKNFCLYIR